MAERSESSRVDSDFTVDRSKARELRAPVAQPQTPVAFVLQVLVHRQRTIAWTAGLSILVAVLYLLFATPTYLVSSRLYAAQGAKLAAEQTSHPADRAFLNTQAKVLCSTPTLALALAQPGIDQLAMFEDVDDRIEYLKKELETWVGEKDEIVTIELQSAYPRDAERFLAALVDSYLKYQSTQIKSSAGLLLVNLQKQRSDTLAELERKRDEIVRFKRQHGTLSFDDEKASFIIRSLNSLSDSLIAARMATLNAKAAYEEASRSMPVPKGDEVADQAITLDERSEADLRGALTVLDQRLSALRHNYGSAHPQVQAVEARLKAVRVALVLALRRNAEAAVQMEADLQKSFDQQQKLALDQAGKAAEYARLEAEVRRLEKAADILDSHVTQLNLSEEAEAASLRVLEPATAEPKPSSPRKLRTLVIALVLGLILGLGVGSVKELVEVRLRSADQITAAVGLPVLAAIPPMAPEHTPAMHARMLLADPRSEVADAVRTICTAIRHSPAQEQAKTLLVTSPAAGEGKTTIAANLAAAFAAARQRVLLIDGDTRMPVLHEIFEVNNQAGLTSLLDGTAAWQDAIGHTADSHLDVLPCGPFAGNVLELLNSESLSELLKQLGEQYDRIVIDAPPLSAGPDARILGANADMTLLVLRGDRVLQGVIEDAIDDLVSVGASIMGVIVNLTRPGSDYQPPARNAYKAYRRGFAPSVNGNGHHATTTAAAERTN